MHERRFDSKGDETGSSRLEFGGHPATASAPSGPAGMRAPHDAPSLASSAE
jgi:hypothetical protein